MMKLDAAVRALQEEQAQLAALRADYAMIRRSRFHALLTLTRSLKHLFAGISSEESTHPASMPSKPIEGHNRATIAAIGIHETSAAAISDLQLQLQAAARRMAMLKEQAKIGEAEIAKTVQQRDDYFAELQSAVTEIETMQTQLATERGARAALFAENASLLQRLESSWTSIAVRDVRLAEALKQKAVFSSALQAAHRRLWELSRSLTQLEPEIGIAKNAEVPHVTNARRSLIGALREVLFWKTVAAEHGALAEELIRTESALASQRNLAIELDAAKEHYKAKLQTAEAGAAQLESRLDLELHHRRTAEAKYQALQQTYSAAVEKVAEQKIAIEELGAAYKSLEDRFQRHHERFVSVLSADISDFQCRIKEIQGSRFWKIKLLLIAYVSRVRAILYNVGTIFRRRRSGVPVRVAKLHDNQINP
ncbi:MAG: hypothetical protein JO033_27160 [Acidobacteriaceae bacterium]|nr:hypothetical protein [Acidobacteriaceae bacterium]